MTAQLLALQELRAGAKPDVTVGVRAGVVEVQRAQTGIAGIVASAATEREPLNASPF